MPIEAEYSCAPENLGILSVAYPQVRLLKDPFPPFIADNRVICVTERDLPQYRSKSIIQITRNSPWHIDSKQGWVKFLREHMSITLSQEREERLLSMDDDMFWFNAKLAVMLGKYPPAVDRDAGSIFMIFVHMFNDFAEVYKNYWAAEQHHKVVLSSLMTMMQKTQINFADANLSTGYKKALNNNKPHYDRFNKHLLQYLRSPQTEWCFLGFLAELSADKRLPLWPSA